MAGVRQVRLPQAPGLVAVVVRPGYAALNFGIGRFLVLWAYSFAAVLFAQVGVPSLFLAG